MPKAMQAATNIYNWNSIILYYNFGYPEITTTNHESVISSHCVMVMDTTMYIWKRKKILCIWKLKKPEVLGSLFLVAI